MSVVGFDVGNYASYVGVARGGGVEIIANEYSERMTPTCVSFKDNVRVMGQAAKQQEINHLKSTFSCFKRLIGRKFSDPFVQKEIETLPYEITAGDGDSIVIKAQYMGEKRSFSPEQIFAMMLTKLAHITLNATALQVINCVLSVPFFATDLERRAVLEACQFANLNCLRLLSDTTAVALNYGLYKQDLPALNQKPRIVVFVDIGYTNTQASMVAFNKSKLKVLAVTYDNELGGRDFDRVIMDHFREEIKNNKRVDVYKNARGTLRLRAQCERCKKMMSTISTAVPVDVECLIGDDDFHGFMSRTEFEEMAKPLLDRIYIVLTNLLRFSQQSKEDIFAVEIVGGSTRIPAVKNLIKDLFGQEASTTLNADEAVARGCTLMSAILSPSFKVREFKIEDCQPFPITLSWQGSANEDNEVEVFSTFNSIPMSKMLSFFKKEPLTIEARYSYPNDIPYPESKIGYFRIEKIIPDVEGNPSKIKVKVRINKNGIFEISQALLVESLEEEMEVDAEHKPNEEKLANQQEQTAETSKGDATNADTSAMDAQTTQEGTNEAGAENVEDKKRKKKVKTTELPIISRIRQLTQNEIQHFSELEMEMISQDKKEKEKSDAMNAVEEYIYDMRDKIQSTHSSFILPDDAKNFMQLLEETENWLYEDSASAQKSIYVQKLDKLKAIGDPVIRRYIEHQGRPSAFEELGKSIQQCEKAYMAWMNKDENYAHLSVDEMNKVANALDEKRKWYQEKYNVSASVKNYQDCPVTISQIKQARADLEHTCLPIIRKPKPKPAPPEPPKDCSGNATTQQQQQQSNGEQSEKRADATNRGQSEPMDVD